MNIYCDFCEGLLAKDVSEWIGPTICRQCYERKQLPIPCEGLRERIEE